jgi:hypothetical protein
MCLFYVFLRRDFGKLLAAKENKTIIAVIRLSHGSAISSHTYNSTPSHTISSNGSIVFGSSKQLNDQFALRQSRRLCACSILKLQV